MNLREILDRFKIGSQMSPPDATQSRVKMREVLRRLAKRNITPEQAKQEVVELDRNESPTE